MTAFYDITTLLKNALQEDVNVNTVSEGDIFKVDLSKQTIFPLSHIMVGSVLHQGPVVSFSVSIILTDIVDINNEQTKDVFVGNDNEHDVLNTQFAVGMRLMERARRGDIWGDKYQLDGQPTFEPFTERFENYLAGWALSFNVLYKNNMTIC